MSRDRKEYMREYKLKYYQNNKELIKEKNAKYYEKTKEDRKIRDAEYYIKNKEKIRERRKKYKLMKIKTDPLYRLINNIRKLILMSIKLKGYNKNSKTAEILGCSFVEFRIHLESKFESWMSWDNYGKYNGTPNFGWDIDHIIPMSSGKNEEEIIKLNHYTNLQPLCSLVNRNIKKDKYEPPLIPPTIL